MAAESTTPWVNALADILIEADSPYYELIVDGFFSEFDGDTVADGSYGETVEILANPTLGIPRAEAEQIAGHMYGHPAYTETSGEPKASHRYQSASRRITVGLRRIHAPETARHVVRVMLSDYQGKDGLIFPSAKTLADDLSVSERTVRRAWKWLEEHRVIRKVRQATQHSTIWWLIRPTEEWI